MKYILATFITLSLLLNMSNLSAQSVEDLSQVMEQGYLHADTNGDELSDKLNAYLVLSDDYNQSEVVAAANIAARLAYETVAMDMDITRFISELPDPVEKPIIFIGRNNSEEFSDLRNEEELIPGQGSIEFLSPDEQLKNGGVFISGYDATGIIVAAEYFAGRFPRVWSTEDSTEIGDINNRIREFIQAKEINPKFLGIKKVLVDENKNGISKVDLEIVVETESQQDEVHTLFSEELDGDVLKRDSKLMFDNVERLDIAISSGNASKSITLRSPKILANRTNKSLISEHNPDFTLSSIYSIDGLFKDTNDDFVSDDIGAYISYSGNKAPKELIALAARISLESGGLRIPLVQIAGQDSEPETKGFPILYGTNHYLTKKLIEAEKLFVPELSDGEGYIQFVNDEENERNLLVIDADDEEGLKAISEYVSQRMPFLWDFGKGNFGLDDLETDVRRFYQGVEAQGQVASAVEKLDSWLTRNGDLSKASIEISAKEIPEDFEPYIENLIAKRAPEAEVEIESHSTGFGVGKTIFDKSLDIPWEVDQVRNLFKDEILPSLSEGDEISLDIRVSESKEIRQKLQEELRSELQQQGVQADIKVLSAFKQGYSWLEEEVLPQLQGENVSAVDITFHNLLQSDEIEWQSVGSETRWLQELYPIDLVLARELAIADSLIKFHSTWKEEPTYKVEVRDNSGSIILEESFNPTYTTRPFYDLYPKNDSVRVATGWVKADLNGERIIDQRIKTDLEYFWDYYQSDIFPKIERYVMDIQDGEPSTRHAPYFDELIVNLHLSEPNYRIGIDEHTFSSLDGIHSDIYWQTLNLFSLIGHQYQVDPLQYAGRVMPFIHERQGEPGEATITFTGKEKGIPELKLKYLKQGETEEIVQRYELPNLNVETPSLRGIWISRNDDKLKRALFDIPTDVESDQFENYKGRATEASIDRSYISTERLARMTDFLGDMQAERIFEKDLSYDRISELAMRFSVKDSTNLFQTVTLQQSRNPGSTENPKLFDKTYDHNGKEIVQWDTPIPPEENNEILAKLNTFPEVDVYYMSKSFLGQDVFAADILPIHSSKYVSQAKLNALRPTLFLSAREHGNEVSSTSYVLRLIEYIATDPDFRKYLDRVNLVIQPMKNVDGARLAYQMYQINKDFTNHAGYVGALGVNIRNSISQNPEDPIYPEATVRRDLWRTWLPDVFMNLHGYPKNEWVQNFAGYSAWVRNRNISSRSWWGNRGWFMPGYRWIDDLDHPEYKTASLAVLDSITTSVQNTEPMNEVNQRAYRTYQKYREHEDGFYEHYENDVLVYKSLKGQKISDNGEYDNPKITYVRHTTESPDETAYGDWLKMIGETGIAHVSSVLNYLYDGENRIEEESSEDNGYTILKRYRIKPVLPTGE